MNRNEYKQFLDVKFRNLTFDAEFEYLENILQECLYWDIKLIGINHKFSILLEQYLKQNIPCDEIIDFIYSLEESMDFLIQEGDVSFIQNLYKNHLPSTYSLEECLIEAQNSIYGQ